MSRSAVHNNQSFHQDSSPYPSAVKQGTGRRDPGVPDEDQRPSRLLQMRDGYQRQLLKEKEEKIISMYEDQQRRNQERAERVTRGGGGGVTHQGYPRSKLLQPGFMTQQSADERTLSQVPSNPSLREFFRERRELEARGAYVPPIDQHYKQSKSRTSSSQSLNSQQFTKALNGSAGMDRSHPLVPINLHTPPSHHRSSNNLAHSSSTSFNNKPRPVRHQGGGINSNIVSSSGNAKSFASSPETDENDNYKGLHTAGQVRDKGKAANRQPSVSPPRKIAPPRGGKQQQHQQQGSPEESPSQEKMSDFQKWQMEQSRAREERPQKTNNKRTPLTQRSAPDAGEDEDSRGGGRTADQQEKMLMEKIAEQQAALNRMKREREEESELRRRDAEKSNKQEAAEREQRRQQHQQTQQEEARRRREEEALAKREQQRGATLTRNKDADMTSNTQGSNVNNRRNNAQPTPRQQPLPSHDVSSTSRSPPRRQQQQRLQPHHQRRPLTPEKEEASEEEEEYDIVPGPGNEIYAQEVEGERAAGKLKLIPCKLCGRKFADDRVKKHQAACKKVQKKRRVMDPSKMRTEGTDMAQYVSSGSHRQEPPKKRRADWRRQHEDFIANIRYAKQVHQMEQQGLSPHAIQPPPPSTQDPSLVPCPHCARTFNEHAAERHIPRCQQLKTRPAPNKRH